MGKFVRFLKEELVGGISSISWNRNSKISLIKRKCKFQNIVLQVRWLLVQLACDSAYLTCLTLTLEARILKVGSQLIECWRLMRVVCGESFGGGGHSRLLLEADFLPLAPVMT